MFARRNAWISLAAGLVLLAVSVAEAQITLPGDPDRGTLDGSPLDNLPPHIRLVIDFGMRPDWSPDGERLVFLDGAPLGDIWEIDLATLDARLLTGGFAHRGFARVHHLANGDLLLCGPTSGPMPSEARPEAGRFTGVLSVFRAPFDGEPETLGMPCWEGMATSDSSLRIAWNRSDIDYTDSDLVDRVVNGISEIWTGEILYDSGRASLANVSRIADRTAVSPIAVLEVQDFRPGSNELIITAYAHEGGEVMGIDLATGVATNYSRSIVYEEAESVSPDGSFVLVERDLASNAIPGPLDIWKLSLDGEPEWDRLTHFNRYRGGFYASNPSVSPDGRQIAFQLSIDGPTEGEGNGILLFDIAASGRKAPRPLLDARDLIFEPAPRCVDKLQLTK